MKFSIIIPVYNVEQYIEKCLLSVLKQDYCDYEIIVVDDETPDNSMELVSRISKEFPNKIKIIHQKNKGLGGARNTGVLAASGDYIIFLDSDDYIDSNMLQGLSDSIGLEAPDMVIFNFLFVNTKGKTLSKQRVCEENRICSTEEDKAALLLSPPAAWNKVYKRSFYLESGAMFPEKVLYEDSITRYLIVKAKSILCCNNYWYNYVQRSNSIMHGEVSPKVLDIIKATERALELFDKENLTECRVPVEATLAKSIFVIAQDAYEKQQDNQYVKQLMEYLTSTFQSYRENPYLGDADKQMIEALLSGNHSKYRKQNRIIRFKERLMGYSFIRWLNTLRKKL